MNLMRKLRSAYLALSLAAKGSVISLEKWWGHQSQSENRAKTKPLQTGGGGDRITFSLGLKL